MRGSLTVLTWAMLALGCGSGADGKDRDPDPHTGSAVDDDTDLPPGPDAVTDTFVQGPAADVDVLLAIDSSCTMFDEQAALAAAMPAFFDHFLGSGVDYHIGVVTLDMLTLEGARGQLREADGHRWIAPDTPDAAGVFGELIAVGTGGSALTEGREAVYSALEVLRDSHNAGFVRDGTAIHTVLVSDSDDDSDESLISEAEFVGWLLGLTAVRPAVTFSSIVPLKEAPIYTGYTEAVGGAARDIAADDWVGLLDDIGATTLGLSVSFVLSRTPDPATLEVSVEDGGARYRFDGEDFVYEPADNAVRFVAFVPSPGSTVQVDYLAAAVR